MKITRMDAVEHCKYFSREQGCRNGKACIFDKDNPRRCMPWFYNNECEEFEEREEDGVYE